MPGTSQAPTLVCPHFTSAVDWDAVKSLPLVDTITGTAPRQGTDVQAAWTSHAFHVRFRVEDNDIRATFVERDAPLYKEEVVEVFFDPWGDGLAYYEIEVNPLNAVCDLLLRRSRSGWKKDFSWDCAGLETMVERNPSGWNAEIAIPFSSVVQFAPLPGSRWRGNFYRIDRPQNAPVELSAWSPTFRPHFHLQHRFGTIEFA